MRSAELLGVAAVSGALSPREAAAVVGVNPAYLYKLIRDGAGPRVKQLGTRRLVTAAELRRWLEALPEASEPNGGSQ